MNIKEVFYHLRQQIIRNRKIAIPRHGIILDIGSGGSPHPQANILLDKFLYDGFERGGLSIKIDERFFIQADATKLPFKEKSIDYLICSHLLEHLDAPELLIKEMERVAKKGYIEIPSAALEKLHSFPFHKWFINHDPNTNELLFTRKHSAYFDQDLHQLINLPTNHQMLQSLYRTCYTNGLFIQYPWEDQIKFSINSDANHFPLPTDIRSSKLHHQKDSLLAQAPQTERTKKRKFFNNLYQHSQRLARRHNIIHREQLVRILICPNCRGTVTHHQTNKQLSCNNCQTIFQFANNIANFVNPLTTDFYKTDIKCDGQQKTCDNFPI